ncbi:MAG: hypothetical protein NC121_10585 [Blautia sp.]|nr:hypothetical protein [Blautia sp.]
MDSVLNEGWFAMSLVQQMVNIGNEVKRAVKFDSNSDKKTMFLDKAIRYTELTMKDPKNRKVLPELDISKKVLEDYRGQHILDCTKEQIDHYYNAFVNLL